MPNPVAVMLSTRFLAVTGAWQAFGYHRATKDGDYRPWPGLVAMSDVHMNRHFRKANEVRDTCSQILDPAAAQLSLEEAKSSSRILTARGRVLGGLLVLSAMAITFNAATGVYLALRGKQHRVLGSHPGGRRNLRANCVVALLESLLTTPAFAPRRHHPRALGPGPPHSVRPHHAVRRGFPACFSF
jgi:hypothetical protein